VREQHVLALEDAVRKMTSAVTRRLSIRDRGILQEGFYADIAVFDPDTIIDKATYDNPNQLSVGMQYVFVNGTAVVKSGKVTGAKPGMALRGPGYQQP
jgi:N-acyl-D-amino-acid deacylase